MSERRALEDPRTYAVIGAAMEVHTVMGPGYLEVAYQRALARELESRGIPYEREVEVPLYYKGESLGVPFRVDFVCWNGIMVELKALPATGRNERMQLVHYLRGGLHTTGLLLNFGAESLQFERVDIRLPTTPPSQESPNPRSPLLGGEARRPGPG